MKATGGQVQWADGSATVVCGAPAAGSQLQDFSVRCTTEKRGIFTACCSCWGTGPHQVLGRRPGAAEPAQGSLNTLHSAELCGLLACQWPKDQHPIMQHNRAGQNNRNSNRRHQMLSATFLPTTTELVAALLLDLLLRLCTRAATWVWACAFA